VFEPAHCTPGSTCAGTDAIVLALDSVSPIPDGSTLYTCQVAISAAAAAGSYPRVGRQNSIRAFGRISPLEAAKR
jgi:hypothetical protein